jgi:hypothetical protein
VTAIMRDTASPDLRQTPRALKFGQMLATLPDRLTLDRQTDRTARSSSVRPLSTV